jgi:hypothetical protein
MAGIETDALKGILQSLEHTLNTLDAASVAATQLIMAQRSRTPLSPATLTHDEQQFAALTTQREHMRTVIARWWTLLEDQKH